MTKASKIIFFGNERLATAVDTNVFALRSLIKSGYQVSAVVANYTAGVSRERRALEIVDVAHAYHIPIYLPDKLLDIAPKLKKHNASIGIVVAYGKIIPQEIISIFPQGIINLHPSLLPYYRGPTPIETAILNGDKKTGVSIMKLAARMDAGPIFVQEEIKLSQKETKQELADSLLQTGSKLLTNVLPSILTGALAAKPQDETRATYTRKLSKQDSFIDWEKPALAIERQVRAFAGYPKSKAIIQGHEVIITKVKVLKSAPLNSLSIKARSGWIEILELIAPSGRTITGREFLRGYKS